MQLNASDHRIYQHLNHPFRVMGMTLDELCWFIFFLVLFYISDFLLWKAVFVLMSLGGVYLIKKGKKLFAGFSMPSFIHWYFGYMVRASFSWPRSWNRFWLS